MKQATLVTPGKIEIREVPVPDPLKGEILIKVRSALTCGTDLKAYIHGHKLIPMPGPFGHEYSGIAAKVGKDVRHFKEGDEIMGVHSAPCDTCVYCNKRVFNLCEKIMETKALGAFADYLLLPSHVVKYNLFMKPSDIGFEHAAMLEPLSCVVHPYNKATSYSSVQGSVSGKVNRRIHFSGATERGNDLHDGPVNVHHDIETALILGAGSIGLMHTAFLKMLGAQVIVCDLLDDRLDIARKIGADDITSPETIRESLQKMTGSMGVDLVIECTGNPRVWEKAITYTRKGGSVVLFGGCPSGTSVRYQTDRVHYDELTIMGSFHYTPMDVKTAYTLITDQMMDLSPLISGSFSLHDIDNVFHLLEAGKGIKYALSV